MKRDVDKDTSSMTEAGNVIPDKRIPIRGTRSLRWRLQFWHALILAIVVFIFAAAFYRQLRHSTFGEIDSELMSGAHVIEGVLRVLPPEQLNASLQDVPMELPDRLGLPPMGLPRDPRRPGRPMRGQRPLDSAERDRDPLPRLLSPDDASLYFVIFSKDGKVLRDESGEVLVDFEKPRNAIANRRIDERHEVLLRGPGDTVIVVGRDVHHQLDRLTHWLVQLILIGIGVMALGLIGGWWLVGNAIRPIEQISQTAAKISGTNLTERVDTSVMDTELQSLGSILNSMLTRLETAFEQQSQFIADASHELRTPISVLLSHCELALNRQRSAAEYQQTIATCQSAAQRMQTLVESLLTLARAEAGHLRLAREECDLHELAKEGVAFLQPFANEKKIVLVVQGGPALCWIDPGRVSQVITNLIQNAIVYGNQGSDSSTAKGMDAGEVGEEPDPPGSAAKVIVSTEDNGEFAELFVQDFGEGIASESVPKLFDRFYRVDTARARSELRLQTGSGLGLAICKCIVDAHNGHLSVTSKKDHGTTFTVAFPCKESLVAQSTESQYTK